MTLRVLQCTVLMMFATFTQQALAACQGIDRSPLVVSDYVENQYMTYLRFAPSANDQQLTLSGSQTAVTVSYAGQCEVFDASQYQGVKIDLADGGQTYHGEDLAFHQWVNGSDGNDVIYTGSAVDYVYGNAGNDQIFTNDNFEKIDGGSGADCAEQGGLGSISSELTNIEATNCADYQPVHCTGIDRSNLLIATDNSYNPYLSYLSVSPQLLHEELVAEGDEALLVLYYDNQCEVLDISDYQGLRVNLNNYDGSYDGSALNFHQLVFGGDGDDTIITGDKVDYVFAGNGDDTIYTNADYEQVDGGAGVDCVNEGEVGAITSQLSNVEQTSCAPVGDAPSSLVNAFQLCFFQDEGFQSELVNGTWNITTKSANISLFVEQHGDYLFAYTFGYRHCAYSTDVDLLNVTLTDGNDVFNATNISTDINVYALGGDDIVYAGKGNDLIFGGDGKDKLLGNDGNDWLIGDSQIETDHAGVVYTVKLSGYSDDDADTIDGGNGDDVIFGNGGADKLSGGNGDDLVFGNASGEDRINGDAGSDLLVDSGGTTWKNRAKMWGGSGQDILICEAGECELSGGSSNDFLAQLAQYADVELYGGDGSDVLYLRSDEIPVGSGGSGTDWCYNTWSETKICDRIASVESENGQFATAVRKAASKMSSQHETAMKLAYFDDSLGHSSFKTKIANLVSKTTFNAWQKARQKNVYGLQ